MSVIIDGSASVTINDGSVLGITSGTAVASTSGTAIDFTSIPSWVKRITVMFNGVSTNGTSIVQIQLGDAGGIEATGYVGYGVRLGNTGGSYEAWSTGAAITNLVEAANLFSGSFTIQLLSSNLWVITGVGGVTNDTNRGLTMYGTKTLSDTLTQIRITTVGSPATNTFDAGSVNIIYEG